MKFSKKSVLSFALALALIFTILPMPVSAAAVLGKSAFALNGPSAAVEVNGTEDEEAQVIFSMVNAGAVTMHQAQFDVVENEGAGNLTLTKLQAPFSHGGTNELVASTGKVLYADSSLVGYAVEAGGSAITATYVVDKDTPTGTYTVDYYVEYVELANGDYIEEMTYTATINVINTATPAPSQNYTVTLDADKSQVKIGETVIVTATVTGGEFNGINGKITYDTNNFQLTSATGHAIQNQTDDGSVELYSLLDGDNHAGYDDETVIATLTFTANKAVENGTFNVVATVGAYDNFLKDEAAATPVNATVKVIETYTVSIAGGIQNGTVAVSGDKTAFAAGDSVPLTVTPAEQYELETLIVDGVDVTADVEDNKYTFTMPAYNVTVNATFKQIAPQFTVSVGEFDYATGVTLVLVTGENENGYTYNDEAMYYVEKYNAYAWVVDGNVTEAEAAAAVEEAASGTVTTISAGYDVNGTDKVDFNDAGAAFGCYNKAYAVAENVAMYLRADVNGDKTVNGTDVSEIMGNYTNK